MYEHDEIGPPIVCPRTLPTGQPNPKWAARMVELRALLPHIPPHVRLFRRAPDTLHPAVAFLQARRGEQFTTVEVAQAIGRSAKPTQEALGRARGRMAHVVGVRGNCHIWTYIGEEVDHERTGD